MLLSSQMEAVGHAPQMAIRKPFLHCLHLRNVRCFELLRIDFISGPDATPRIFTLLLGDNNAGKTTILQAIALATAGPDAFIELLGERPEAWIRHDAAAAGIEIHLLAPDGQPFSLTIEIVRGHSVSQAYDHNRHAMERFAQWVRADPGHFFTSGYGVSRRLSPNPLGAGDRLLSFKQMRSQRVATLFSADALLRPPQKVAIDLAGLDPNLGRQAFAKAFQGVLQGLTYQTVDRENYDLIFTDGDQRPWRLSQLGAGMQNVVAWWGDLFHHLCAINPAAALEKPDYSPLTLPGLLLLDEMDLHLHPTWQRGLRRFLRARLPNLQIVATSHSPFVVQSLEKNELICLDPGVDPENPYADKSIEDIAMNLMGIEVPQRSERFQQMMETAERYYLLLQQAKKAQPEELRDLKARLDALALPYSDNVAYHTFLRMEQETSGIPWPQGRENA
ncbi:MAG: AAA family ATPase [Magnetococcales bacterium]|nr:AAA family ATPase [Magnetococcales bacterium]